MPLVVWKVCTVKRIWDDAHTESGIGKCLMQITRRRDITVCVPENHPAKNGIPFEPLRQVATVKNRDVFQPKYPTKLAYRESIPEIPSAVGIDEYKIGGAEMCDGLPHHIDQPQYLIALGRGILYAKTFLFHQRTEHLNGGSGISVARKFIADVQ